MPMTGMPSDHRVVICLQYKSAEEWHLYYVVTILLVILPFQNNGGESFMFK